jgi:hypothetical protein
MDNHADVKTGNLSFEAFKRVFFEDPELVKQKTFYNLTPKNSDSEKKQDKFSRKRS